MGKGTAFLTALRVSAVLVAATGIGLGAWSLIIVHGIHARGSFVLNSLLLEAGNEILWRRFFDAAVTSQTRIWIAIAAAAFNFLASFFVVLATNIKRLKPTHHLLIPLEFVSMFAMATAFGASFSFAIRLDSTCFRLDPSSSSGLKSFETLCPLSKGYAIGNGTGGFLLAVTSLAALISVCARSRSPESCSFEPTASGLGMGHGYLPPPGHTTIPAIYDPLKHTPGPPQRPPREDEGGLLEMGARMGVRQSMEGEPRRSMQAEISGPLGLESPETVQKMRPHRPWSEMPR